MISSLGYLLWQSPDAEGWDAFAKDVLGFMPVDGPSGRDRCFRIDDYPYRLVVTPGPKRLLGVGLEVVDDLALGRLVGHLEALGVEATTGSESECDERRCRGSSASSTRTACRSRSSTGRCWITSRCRRRWSRAS